MKKYKIIIAVTVFVISVLSIYLILNKKPSGILTDPNVKVINIDNSKKESNIIVNPASDNCKKLGGSVVTNKFPDGSKYNLCMFEENRACEEFTLLVGDCPYGGRKTTGYDTIDQKYCAWKGGMTFAQDNSICTFKDGSKCSTIDFYNGKCAGPQ